MMTNLAHYNKFWIALAGAVLQAVMLSFPNTVYAIFAQCLVGTLTALGVFVVPNAPKLEVKK